MRDLKLLCSKLTRVSLIAVFSFYIPIRANAEPIIMGYWESWATYDNFPVPNNAKGSTNNILSEQVKVVNTLAYAFLGVAKDGSIKFNDPKSDLSRTNLKDKKFCELFPLSCPGFPQSADQGNFSAFTNVKVKHHVVSIGGAGRDKDWDLALAHPDRFVKSLKYLSNSYDIDWVDLDFETDLILPTTNIKKFVELAAKIKANIPGIIISYPVSANSKKVIKFGKTNWHELNKNIDYISVMGYDMHGIFDNPPLTALHSALHSNDQKNSSSVIAALNSVGIENSKIILGIPMYGHALGGVKKKGLGQIFTQSVKGDLDEKNCSIQIKNKTPCLGTLRYKTINSQGYKANPVIIKNQIVGAYAYNPSEKTFISYDNDESAAAKAQYVIDQNLAGLMFWALRHDLPIKDSKSILNAVNIIFRKHNRN